MAVEVGERGRDKVNSITGIIPTVVVVVLAGLWNSIDQRCIPVLMALNLHG